MLSVRRQMNYYSISIALSVCALLILIRYGYLKVSYLYHSCPTTLDHNSIVCVEKPKNYATVVLDFTRWNIHFEMMNYSFSESGVNKLEDLLLEHGGTPVRSLVISTWRSGSSFLGDLLNAMPNNYYQYEPLNFFGNNQIRKNNLDEAIQTVKSMFQCDFTNLEEYFNFLKNNTKYHRYPNNRLASYCKLQKDICTDAEFMTKFCKLFPFQSMKIVRLRLCFVEAVIADKGLNVKTVLLIRDPRGVMQSRLHVKFCRNSDCVSPETLCSGMVSDYVTARQFLQKYPGRLMVIRFEDLAQNLKVTKRRLLKFLRLQATTTVDGFLLSHTRVETGGPFSTFRVSRDVATKWTRLLKFEYVAELQEICKDAMKLWGYKLADNASHMAGKQFYPLEPFSME